MELENRASEIEAFLTGKGKGSTLTGVMYIVKLQAKSLD